MQQGILIFVFSMIQFFHPMGRALEAASSFNFLFLPMGLEMTHKRSIWPIAEALGKKGHHVSFWTTAISNKTDSSNFIAEDIVAVVNHETWNEAAMKDFQKETWYLYGLPPLALMLPWWASIDVCQHAFKENRQQIEQISQRKWDLIVIDSYFSPCGFLIAKLSKAPVVLWSSSLQGPNIGHGTGIPNNPSYVPQLSATPEALPLGDSVLNRAVSLLHFWSYYPLFKFFAYRIRNVIAPGEFDEFSFEGANNDAILHAAHISPYLNWPSPWVPGIFHLQETCRPSSATLPTDLEAFVSDPMSKGTILIAFGHMGRWSTAPAASYKGLRDALLRLKDYRIVWQCDIEEEDPTFATHIRRLSWIPQNDLLYHQKTLLFLTHAGLKSFMESVCSGVPLVAMPLFAEQYRNTAAVLEKQIGVYLDKFKLSDVNYVYKTLNSVLSNNTYSSNVRKANSILRDNPVSPFDYAVQRFEFAARQGNRLHTLRLRSADFSCLTYFSIDSIVFLGASTMTLLYVIYCIPRLVWRRLVSQ